jgi:hypothetical protein
MRAEKSEMGEPNLEGLEPSDRRHYAHKRVERWIRLQQFVYGLPDDYAYAVCIRERAGRAESATLVSVGWLTWFGRAKGADRQHALALALLEMREAITSSSGRIFWQTVRTWLRRRLLGARIRVESEAEERLAG